ncbi:hypothetical protein BV898_15983 [Hypsibius exemplaris]|uniref:Uncharacterized protein n=1 Tax=Hypsibius exemplaris TaxID=2072580 RepID=A0A9X6NF06_HYPEX|nr:hypothetical protein BV898_15983 [Hypsibius exemplaris]
MAFNCRPDVFSDSPSVVCSNTDRDTSSTELMNALQLQFDKDLVTTIILNNTRSLDDSIRHPHLELDFSAGTFDGYVNLKRLYTHHVTTLETLEIIDSLAFTPAVLSRIFHGDVLPNLQQFRLERNEDEVIRIHLGDLSQTPQLRNLSLSHNSIDSIDYSIIDPNLQFDLQFSSVQFNLRFDLRYLDLSFARDGLKFQGFNRTFFRLFPWLESLSLAHTGLRSEMFREIIEGFPKTLHTLDLSLNSLRGSLVLEELNRFRFPNLRSLNLSGNPDLFLTAANDFQFLVLPNLETLLIRDTGMPNVPVKMLEHFPQLTTLDLRDNLFSFFPNSLTAKFWSSKRGVGTRKLLLQGNPLVCNCGMTYLMHWLDAGTSHVPRGREILCREERTVGRSSWVCPTCIVDGSLRVHISMETALRHNSIQGMNCMAIPEHSDGPPPPDLTATPPISDAVTFIFIVGAAASRHANKPATKSSRLHPHQHLRIGQLPTTCDRIT